jgi:hypothetical protein
MVWDPVRKITFQRDTYDSMMATREATQRVKLVETQKVVLGSSEAVGDVDHALKMKVEIGIMKVTDAMWHASDPQSLQKMQNDLDNLNAWIPIVKSPQPLPLPMQHNLEKLLIEIDKPPSKWVTVQAVSVPRGSGQMNMTIPKQSAKPPSPRMPPPPTMPPPRELLAKAKDMELKAKDKELKARANAEALQKVGHHASWAKTSWDVATIVASKDRKVEDKKNPDETSKKAAKRQRQMTKAQLTTKLGREPTDAEVADAMGSKVDETPDTSESEKGKAVPQQKADPRQKTPEEVAKKTAKKQRQKMKAELRTKLSREPTDAEVAAALGLKVDESDSEKMVAHPKRLDREMTNFSAPNPKVHITSAASSSGAAPSSSDQKDALKLQKFDPSSCEADENSGDLPKINKEEFDRQMYEPSKSQLDCKNSEMCENVGLRRSDFLPDDGDASWQGRIWGVCQECSAPARSSLNNVHEKMAACFPGASKTLIRDLAIRRTKSIAAAFLESFNLMNEYEKRIAHNISQDYIKSLERAAADPTCAATPAGHALSAEEAS